MQITRTSILTGIKRTIDIDCHPEQLEAWERGEDLIQNLMPGISAEMREFIMTGITEEEWESGFDDYSDDNGHSYEAPF